MHMPGASWPFRKSLSMYYCRTQAKFHLLLSTQADKTVCPTWWVHMRIMLVESTVHCPDVSAHMSMYDHVAWHTPNWFNLPTVPIRRLCNIVRECCVPPKKGFFFWQYKTPQFMSSEAAGLFWHITRATHLHQRFKLLVVTGAFLRMLWTLSIAHVLCWVGCCLASFTRCLTFHGRLRRWLAKAQPNFRYSASFRHRSSLSEANGIEVQQKFFKSTAGSRTRLYTVPLLCW